VIAALVVAAAGLGWGPALYPGGPGTGAGEADPGAGGADPAAASRRSEPTLRRIGRDIRVTGVPPRGIVGGILRIAVSPAQELVTIEVAPEGRRGDLRGSRIHIHGLSMATVRELGLDQPAGTAERLRATRRDSPAGPRIRLTLTAEDGADIALLGDDSGPNAAVVAGRHLQAADSARGRPPVLLVHLEEQLAVFPGEPLRLAGADRIGSDGAETAESAGRAVAPSTEAEAWTFLLLGARLAQASDGADGADRAAVAEAQRASFDWMAVRQVENRTNAAD